MKLLNYIIYFLIILLAGFALYNWYDGNQITKQVNEDKQKSDSLAIELGKLIERINEEAKAPVRTINEITVIRQNITKIPEKIKALPPKEKTKQAHERLGEGTKF